MDPQVVYLSDDQVKKINQQNEELEGTLVEEDKSEPGNLQQIGDPEKNLLARVNAGEWDNLDGLSAFKSRTPEGQLMARIEAIDNRIDQLQRRLPMLLNQYLHDAYIQVLKKISALRKTKGALFYHSYKNAGQRDLPSGD